MPEASPHKRPAEGDADSDSVSLAFTEASEPREQYEIADVLAEDLLETLDANGQPARTRHYLVSWYGYPWYRNSWEPEAILNEDVPELVHDWHARKRQQDAGLVKAFDVARWLDQIAKFTADNCRRRQIRNRKRKQRGLAPWPFPLTGEVYEVAPESDTPRGSRQPTPAAGGSAQSSARASPAPARAAPEPGQERKRKAEDDSDSSDNRPLSSRRRRTARSSVSSEDLALAPKRRSSPPKPLALPMRTSSNLAAKPPPPQPKAGPKPNAATVATVAAATITQEGSKRSTSAALPRAAAGSRQETARPRPIAANAIRPGFRPGSRLRPNVFTGGKETKTRAKGPHAPRLYSSLRIRNLANKTVDKAPVLMPAHLKQLDGGGIIASPSSMPTPAGISSQTIPKPSSVPEEEPASARVPPKYPSLECWYHFNGAVHPTGKACPFEHQRTGYAAGTNNDLLKEQASCPEWWEDRCTRGAKNCRWLHGIARYLIGDDGLPVKWDPDQAEQLLAKRDGDNDLKTTIWPGPPSIYITSYAKRDVNPFTISRRGCFYHHVEGYCHKGESCSFTHCYVDWVTDKTGNPFYVGELANKPWRSADDVPHVPRPRRSGITARDEEEALRRKHPPLEIRESHRFPPKNALIGCFYHHVGAGCQKLPDQCEFHHGPVDWVKGRGHFFWVGEISNVPTPEDSQGPRSTLAQRHNLSEEDLPPHQTTRQEPVIRRVDLKYEPFEVNANYAQGPLANEKLACYEYVFLSACADRDCKYSHNVKNVDWVNGGGETPLDNGVFYWIGRRSGCQQPPCCTETSASVTAKKHDDDVNRDDNDNERAKSKSPVLADRRTHGHRYRTSPSPPRRELEQKQLAVAATPADNGDCFTPIEFDMGRMDDQFAAKTVKTQPGMSHTLQARFAEGEPISLNVKLDGIAPDVERELQLSSAEMSEPGSRLLLAKDFILADALAHLLPSYRKYLAVGDVRVQRGFADSVANLKHSLSCARAAAVIRRPRCYILIYPRPHECSEWHFLDPDAPTDKSNLRYAIISPIINVGAPDDAPDTFLSERKAHAQKRYTAALKPMALEKQAIKGQLFKDNDVFVFFPPRLDVEQQALVDALQGIARNRTDGVFTNAIPGSWMAFSKNLVQGTIIFHEAFTSFDKIQGLAEILFKRGAVSLFRLVEGRTVQLQPLFPWGRAVLLLDDLFDGQEDQALEMVKYVQRRMTMLQEQAFLYFKLLGRPGLQSWLLDRSAAEFQAASEVSGPDGVNQGDLVTGQIWTMLNDLTSEDKTSDCVLTPPEDELSPYIYEELYKTNRAAALDKLMQWFSDWSIASAPIFRRFIVVTSAPFAQRNRWSDQYKHIGIYRPDDWRQAEDQLSQKKENHRLAKEASEMRKNAEKQKAAHAAGASPGSAGRGAPLLNTTQHVAPRSPLSPAEKPAPNHEGLPKWTANLNDPRLRARNK